MYPVKDECCQAKAKTNKESKVPFNIRKPEDYQSPLPPGFIQVPVYNHMETRSNIDLKACTYAQQSRVVLEDLNSQYEDFLYLIEPLKKPLAEAYGLNETFMANITYIEI
jgi:hypothetical protein